MYSFEETRISESVDFIHNRFDIIYSDDRAIRAKNNAGDEYNLPFHAEGDSIYLGTYMCEIPGDLLKDACSYLFARFPEAKYVKYKFAICSLKDGIVNRSVSSEYNFWSVVFGDKTEDLHLRLNSKSRNTLKRKKRIARENLGEYKVINYTTEEVPDEIIYKYFEFKKSSHGIDYNMSPQGYLKSFFVTDVYVLKFGDTIGAIVLSCEQFNTVYLENLTYNPEYKNLSLGSILYDHFLEMLSAKEKESIVLGYGDYQYKAAYGAVESVAHSGTVFRTTILYIKEITLPKLNRKIKSAVKRILKRLGIMRLFCRQ